MKTFHACDIQIHKCHPNELKLKPEIDQVTAFGHFYTDHMFNCDWDSENGWSTPHIHKIRNLAIHPGAKVLHYALGAFEGAKAFRGVDNKIRFFRLSDNVNRLLHSAKRLSLPEFDPLELMKCIHKLVHLEQDWIPRQPLTALYIRPTILGTDPSLGVSSSKNAMLYVLLSPVGPYFKTGFKPISLYADPDFVRAWPGGAGNTKLSSNYGPTVKVQDIAEELGLQQVLWLYGEDMKLTEVGTMNIFVSFRDASGKLHLVTPPLSDGLILPGITRSSILQLARQWDDLVCEERYVTIGEIRQLIAENRLVEIFGAGTACVVCPISKIHMKDGHVIHIPHSSEVSERLLKAITDIQYGVVRHPWTEELSYN